MDDSPESIWRTRWGKGCLFHENPSVGGVEYTRVNQWVSVSEPPEDVEVLS